jgi:hypothetical protein
VVRFLDVVWVLAAAALPVLIVLIYVTRRRWERRRPEPAEIARATPPRPPA